MGRASVVSLFFLQLSQTRQNSVKVESCFLREVLETTMIISNWVVSHKKMGRKNINGKTTLKFRMQGFLEISGR